MTEKEKHFWLGRSRTWTLDGISIASWEKSTTCRPLCHPLMELMLSSKPKLHYWRHWVVVWSVILNDTTPENTIVGILSPTHLLITLVEAWLRWLDKTSQPRSPQQLLLLLLLLLGAGALARHQVKKSRRMLKAINPYSIYYLLQGWLKGGSKRALWRVRNH